MVDTINSNRATLDRGFSYGYSPKIDNILPFTLLDEGANILLCIFVNIKYRKDTTFHLLTEITHTHAKIFIHSVTYNAHTQT